MENYLCSTCSKLEEATDCRGCILRDYFKTDEDIEQLKAGLAQLSKEKFTRSIERIISKGATAVTVASITAQLVLVAPRFRLLSKLRDEVDALTHRMDAVADCDDKVGELTARVNGLDVSVHRLLTDDDSLTHVSESPFGSPDVACTHVSDSPPSADDGFAPRIGLFRRRTSRHKSS